MFEKNFEKKYFEKATQAFTKAINDLDGIVNEADLELSDLADRMGKLESDAKNIRSTRNRVAKTQDKLKEIFGE